MCQTAAGCAGHRALPGRPPQLPEGPRLRFATLQLPLTWSVPNAGSRRGAAGIRLGPGRSPFPALLKGVFYFFYFEADELAMCLV